MVGVMLRVPGETGDQTRAAAASTLFEVAIRNERVILRRTHLWPQQSQQSTGSSLRANLAQRWAYLPSEELKMATGKKSSGRKARKPATKTRAGSRGKAAAKTKTKRAATSKTAAKKKTARGSSASKRKTTRAARKQSPVTRIKRVATTVLQQGATAAKQGVQAVERLVEEVKDRVTPS